MPAVDDIVTVYAATRGADLLAIAVCMPQRRLANLACTSSSDIFSISGKVSLLGFRKGRRRAAVRDRSEDKPISLCLAALGVHCWWLCYSRRAHAPRGR